MIRIIALLLLLAFPASAQFITQPPSGARFFSSGASFTSANSTAEQNAATIALPPLSPTGSIIIFATFSNNNSADNKTYRIRLSATSGSSSGTSCLVATVTTSTQFFYINTIRNQGATNDQWCGAQGGGLGAQVAASPTIETASASFINITIQKATGTDTAILEGYTVIVIP